MATHPLENAEVLRKVLEQLPNRQLLVLSLVNKQWNFEARCVLRGRGNLAARISTRDPCLNLAAFASDLAKIRVVPFSGMHIQLLHVQICQSSSNRSLDPSCNVILEALPWKHLSVSFRDRWYQCKNCPALELVRKILERSHGALEEMSLVVDFEVQFQQVFLGCTFPRLKILRIQGCSREKSLTSFIKALVSSAPNLEKLIFSADLFFKQNVLKGSSAVLVPAGQFRPLYERICESLIGSIRAETIEILVDPNNPFDAESLNMIVPRALQASHISLKTLRMDLLFAVPLMCYGICLENVKKLEVRVRIDSRFLGLLKCFDFTRVFPKLQEVQIVNHRMVAFTPELIRGFIERWSMILTTHLPNRAVHIKRLILNECEWEAMLPFLARTFPHLKSLSVNTGTGDLFQFPFSLLWEQFVNLEELTITTIYSALSVAVNLDCVFCGILLAEVAELMERSDKYLMAVNLVPVMPSIVRLRGDLTSNWDDIEMTVKIDRDYCRSEDI